MPGETESLTSDFEKIKTKLDNWSKENELDFPANFSSINIKDLSAEGCGELSADIAAFAMHIQKMLSKESSYLHWLESKINLAIADELNSYAGYYSHEQRKAKAIVNNQYAKKLEELRINTQLKVDSLSQLPFQINQLCRAVMEAQASKRYGKTNHS